MKWLEITVLLGIIIAGDARRGPARRNGRRFNWRGQDSSASDNPCSEQPTISMGKGVPRRTWSAGIRVQFGCYYDYHIYGEKYVTCKNGHWSNPFPICTSNDCEHPSIPQGLRPLSLRRNSVLMFNCDDGMVTDGHKMIYCQNQHWSGPPPKCIHRHIPVKYCTFQQEACGWLNGYSAALTWALHPGGYVQTRTPDSIGSYGHWTFIDSLPTSPPPTSTLTSTTSTSTKMPSTTSSSSTVTSSKASSTVIVNTSSTRYDLQSSTPISESHSLDHSTPASLPTNSTTSATNQESSSTPIPRSTTNQPTARKKRSVTVFPSPAPPQRAELVSPEYPSNYSGACFRLQYLANGTIRDATGASEWYYYSPSCLPSRTRRPPAA